LDDHSRRSASASLHLPQESLLHESALYDDSHWPSIPASRGPSPAARVTIPRRELLPLGGRGHSVAAEPQAWGSITEMTTPADRRRYRSAPWAALGLLASL